jgi:uncharacterized protein
VTNLRAPLAVFALLLAAAVCAQQPVPALSGRVVDRTGTLPAQAVAQLEARLAELEQSRGSQLAVLVVATTKPETVEQFALRVAEQWQLGRGDVDDGVLLLVALEDRELRIEVGYGLEGAIPDAAANRIIDEFIVPKFRADDYAGGIVAGVERLAGLIDGEPLPPPKKRDIGSAFESILPIAFVISLIVGGFLKQWLGQLPGAAVAGGLVALLAWLLLGALVTALIIGLISFFFTLFSSGSPGRWSSGGRRGGFGRGGFGGGGGFRGGGGSFGGGGASGRW